MVVDSPRRRRPVGSATPGRAPSATRSSRSPIRSLTAAMSTRKGSDRGRGGPGRATTALVRDGETIAVLIHRDDLLGDPTFVEEVASAARLAFENERLHAQARPNSSTCAPHGHGSSPRPTMSATARAGPPRRRPATHRRPDPCARPAHPARLGRRAGRSPRWSRPPRPTLSAVDELRRLASGIHPAVLTDSGCPPPSEPWARPQPRPATRHRRRTSGSPPAETAAYLVVAEAAKWARAVTIIRRDETSSSTSTPLAGPPRSSISRTASAPSTARCRPSRQRDANPGGDPMRVVIADDSMIVREGLARLLGDAGCEVVGTAGDAQSCCACRTPDPTSPSSTSRCRRPTPTKESPPHSRSAARHPTSACSCCPSTSSPSTPRGCSPRYLTGRLPPQGAPRRHRRARGRPEAHRRGRMRRRPDHRVPARPPVPRALPARRAHRTGNERSSA